MTTHKSYKAIVLGLSSGGMNALTRLLPGFPDAFRLPVIIVQHLNAQSGTFWIEMLDSKSRMKVKEAEEKEKIENGVVYIAPSNYHLLVEKDGTLTLTIDERVNFARPSIDVLFETAAEAYREQLIGVILTGAGKDGAEGLKRIKEKGGLAIVQDPVEAESPFMPASAISACAVDHVLPLEKIQELLIELDANDYEQPRKPN